VVAHTDFSGLFDYSKNVRKDNLTPAYSPVSDRRRLTALVKVHWARRVQAPMSLITGVIIWVPGLFLGGSLAIISSCRRTVNMKTFSTFSYTPYLSFELKTGSKLSFLPSNGTSARR
jgi:hypothetical protein